MAGQFQSKAIAITGGCGAIGSAAARSFLAQGASIALLDVNKQAIEDILEKPNCMFVHTDVSDEGSFSRSLDAVMDKYGRLDILINAAGIIGPNTMIQDTRVEDWDETFAINTKGVFIGVKQGARRMTRGGVIVNVASDSGLCGWPKYCAYGASKAAVISITKHAAIELAPLGIRVNGIAPSTVEASQEMSSDEEKAITLAVQAVPKIMSPGEIAKVLLFLSSEDAAMITGHTLVVDGGWTAGLSMGLCSRLLQGRDIDFG